jgi:transposase
MNSTEAGDELYCGADLHGNNVLLALCDAKGVKVFERRVKCRLEAVNAALDPYWYRIKAVAVESTYNWYWFVDGLRGQGRDVRLANPARMSQYDGLKNTDDESDALWIAEQLRLGILPECYVYPQETRPVRDALRRRMLITRQRTQSLLSLESLLARHGLTVPSADKLKSWTDHDVKTLSVDAFTRLQVASLLAMAQKADELAEAIEGEVLKRAKPTASYGRTQQVPGIGKILGLVIALESGEFSRFASAGRYASYCRGVKSARLSNGKKKGENNRKNGNPYLAWAFSEAAVFAIRYYPQIAAWYERKKRKRNKPVAMKALSCKLAKAVWHVMNGKDFDEKTLFG